MDSIHEKFGHFRLATGADGEPIQLPRAQNELVFIAFDTRISRLVELHVLNQGAALDAEGKLQAFDLTQLAVGLTGPSFMKMLEIGGEEDVIFFSSNLSDGEFAHEYAARRGALPAVTVLCLMQQFMDDLVEAAKNERLVTRMHVVDPLVTTVEDAFLKLRVVDYGLTDAEADEGQGGMDRVVADCWKLMFLLLTGQRFDGTDPGCFQAVTCLPMGLQIGMRSALGYYELPAFSLERLRDEVSEACAQLITSLRVRISPRHVEITGPLQPRSQLQEALLEHQPAAELLEGRFKVAQNGDFRAHSFAISATDAKTDLPVTVHLLPPSRILDNSNYEAVPPHMWRFDPERHPNILAVSSVQEAAGWSLLAEERTSGFALSQLLARRSKLNPAEAFVLLRQVCECLEQAQAFRPRHLDIHPANFWLRVGRGGATHEVEFERLLQKSIVAWPSFTVQLRTHVTMRSLCEPLIVDQLTSDEDEHRLGRDLRNRSLVALAVHLLTGGCIAGTKPVFGTCVSEELVAYLDDCVEAGKLPHKTPPPAMFLEEFEKRLSPTVQPEPEPSQNLAVEYVPAVTPPVKATVRIATRRVPLPPLVSVAPVEPASRGTTTRLVPAVTIPAASISLDEPAPKGTMGMLIWGTAVASLIGVAFILFPGAASSKTESVTSASRVNNFASVTHASQVEAFTPPAAPAKPAVAPKLTAAAPKQAPVAPKLEPVAPPPVIQPPPPVEPGGPFMIKRAVVPSAEEIRKIRDEMATR